ncbi:MAG TPA: hypothetical protein VF482_20770, partial [Trebonia sp.]
AGSSESVRVLIVEGEPCSWSRTALTHLRRGQLTAGLTRPAHVCRDCCAMDAVDPRQLPDPSTAADGRFDACTPWWHSSTLDQWQASRPRRRP